MKDLVFAACLLLGALSAVAQEKARAGSHECLIEPWQRIEIRSPLEALIASVPVDRGSAVEKGQVLVLLDSTVEEAALASARHRVTMEGQLASAEARMRFARAKHSRREDLLKQDFISAQDRDEALAELRVAEASLLEARENHTQATLETKRLEQLLSQRRLVSPFAGVVTDRLQSPGELAQTGESARPILKLAQTNPLRVEVYLPAALYGSIKTGQEAEVHPDAPRGKIYKATVHVVDRVVDSASATFGVRLQLANPQKDIPAGIKCRLLFK